MGVYHRYDDFTYNVDCENHYMYPPSRSPEYLFTNKGDSFSFDVRLTINGYPYILKDDEYVWFSVTKDVMNITREEKPVLYIEQQGTHFVWDEFPLDEGTYRFDVGVILNKGTKKKTLLPSLLNRSNKLVVGHRVGYPGLLNADIYEDIFSAKLDKSMCRYCDKHYDVYIKELREDLANLTLVVNDLYSRAFITVETLDDMYALDKEKLANGKIVRVNDINGDDKAMYFIYDEEANELKSMTIG